MTLLKAFRFSDLTNSGYCNPENFLRTFARLGLNIINRENLLDYFNLYDPEHTGRINYKDFITEIFRPTEIERRKIMSKEIQVENKVLISSGIKLMLCSEQIRLNSSISILPELSTSNLFNDFSMSKIVPNPCE